MLLDGSISLRKECVVAFHNLILMTCLEDVYDNDGLCCVLDTNWIILV